MGDSLPLTVETAFWYEGKQYMVTAADKQYLIVGQPGFGTVISNDSFIGLLTMPFFNGKSFKELINNFLFEN